MNPLKGRKIGAYYGCLLLRPADVMAFDNPENPTIIEDFLSRHRRDEPVKYAFRNECCGGYIALEDRAQAAKQVERVLSSAAGRGCGGAGHRLPAVHVQPEAERGRARASGCTISPSCWLRRWV